MALPARLDMAVAKAQGDEEGLKTAREKLRRADDRLNRFEEETGRRRRREREYQPVNAKWPEQPRTPAENTLTDEIGSGKIAMRGDKRMDVVQSADACGKYVDGWRWKWYNSYGAGNQAGRRGKQHP